MNINITVSVYVEQLDISNMVYKVPFKVINNKSVVSDIYVVTDSNFRAKVDDSVEILIRLCELDEKREEKRYMDLQRYNIDFDDDEVLYNGYAIAIDRRVLEIKKLEIPLKEKEGEYYLKVFAKKSKPDSKWQKILIHPIKFIEETIEE